MARVSARVVFGTDYTSLEAVVELAKRLGPGMVVIKHDGRNNYNITHKSRRDRWDLPYVTVVYDTGDK